MPFHPGLNFKGVCWGRTPKERKLDTTAEHAGRWCMFVCMPSCVYLFIFFLQPDLQMGVFDSHFHLFFFSPLPCTSDFSVSCLYLIFLLFLIFKHLPFQSSFRSELLPHQTISQLLCESYFTSWVILLLLYFTLIFHPIGIVCCFKRHLEDECTLSFWELCSVETENTATYLSPHQNSWMKPHKHGERSPIMFAMLVVNEGRS